MTAPADDIKALVLAYGDACYTLAIGRPSNGAEKKRNAALADLLDAIGRLTAPVVPIMPALLTAPSDKATPAGLNRTGANKGHTILKEAIIIVIILVTLIFLIGPDSFKYIRNRFVWRYQEWTGTEEWRQPMPHYSEASIWTNPNLYVVDSTARPGYKRFKKGDRVIRARGIPGWDLDEVSGAIGDTGTYDGTEIVMDNTKYPKVMQVLWEFDLILDDLPSLKPSDVTRDNLENSR